MNTFHFTDKELDTLRTLLKDAETRAATNAFYATADFDRQFFAQQAGVLIALLKKLSTPDTLIRYTQDCVMIPDLSEVELYSVHGAPGWRFPTKLAAAVYARHRFPDDNIEVRHARISYRDYIRSDL